MGNSEKRGNKCVHGLLFWCIRFFAFPLLVFLLLVAADLWRDIPFVALLVILGIQFVMWLGWLIVELVWLHRKGDRFRRNLNLSVIGIYALVLLGGYHLFFGKHHMFTESSPDGKYSISVYTSPRLFAMPGGGGVGSQMTTVVLKNRWGWTIGSSNDQCSVFYDDIHIEWDYEHNQVNFAMARSIDLDTGECLY
jgi:hypothetical protein